MAPVAAEDRIAVPQEAPESRPQAWDVFAPSGEGLGEEHKLGYICASPARSAKLVEASSLAQQ